MSQHCRYSLKRKSFNKGVQIAYTPFLLAKEVAEWIEYDSNNINKLVNMVDDNEKLTRTIFWSGQNREMWLLTEDGLYEVLMQSRKPIAKQFKKLKRTMYESGRKCEIQHPNFYPSILYYYVENGSNPPTYMSTYPQPHYLSVYD